jgi:uracil-DNA glycosylase family 4
MSQGNPNIARPSIAKLVRQHAETARLLGVDFVPVYRDRDSAEAAAPEEPAAQAMSSSAPPAASANPAQQQKEIASTSTPSLRADSAPASEPDLKRSTPAATQKHTAAAQRVEAKPEPVRSKSTQAKADDVSATEAQSTDAARAEIKAAEPTPVATPKPAPQAPRRAPGSAKDPAENQRLLDELRARYEADAPHKNFVTSFTNIVFGEGDPCARLMFVGEAPGEEEDKTGRPFVGRAGQLLDKMIVAMGLRRQDVYIANVLKTRPPNNATPTLEESRLCAPYLYEQISIVDPEVIVTLGLPATRTLLGTMEAMGKLRGKWASFNPGGLAGGKTFAVLPTYHPAYLLRNYTPQERAKVWSDLQMVMDRLGLAKQGADPASENPQ